MEKIWKRQHQLKPFIDKKNFKSYDELKRKLNEVLGLDETFDEVPKAKTQTTAEKFEKRTEKPKSEDEDLPWNSPAESKKNAVTSSDDDDESLEFFKSLAND